MKVVRFDEEISVPAPQTDSRLRAIQLAGEGARVRVDVVHLGAGGHLGLEPAPRRRFLGVTSGVGAVTMPAGRTYQLRTGYGVLIEAGEKGKVESDAGLTAINIEGDFEPATFLVTQEIVVSDYNPEWPRWFERLRDRLWPAVAPVATRIDHVGSTSVPGLSAKPIIDMDIVVSSPEDVESVIDRLRAIGYTWRGDLGVAGREAFRPPADGVDPAHHLYVVVENNKAHLDHWLLRDLLRSDPEARERYASLKRRNQHLADGDIDVYVAGKANFVAELLARAREEHGLPPAAYWNPELPGEHPAAS
jgi:GrpB-like predicted nucleotidyltransferase (UPF0157 family)